MRNYNCQGKKVYIGLDVHQKSFAVTSRCEGVLLKQDTMPASPERLIKYLHKFFPGGKYVSAYEAGFSGFHLHRVLREHGIENIVVHAASIEVSSRDRVKTDKRDSLKIATQLEVGRLRGIDVPSTRQEANREVTRLRETLVGDRHKVGCRIKSFFARHQELQWSSGGVVNRKLVESLFELDLPLLLKETVTTLADSWIYLDSKIQKLNEMIKEQASTGETVYHIVQSAPGIGTLGACILINELGDMRRFSSMKKLFSYTGLTPTEYSSGEHTRHGGITRQGKSILRKVLVQAAWIAIRVDADLSRKYEELSKRIGKKKAIVAIARKLIGRIRTCVLKNEEYHICKKRS